MKRIDFYEKKKTLHNEMLKAIVALFDKAAINEFDLRPDDDWQRNCYITLSTDGADSTREVRVKKVKCDDGAICILPDGEDWWVSCEFAGDVVTCTLDDLYDAVYSMVGDIIRTYYICELKDGKPTGNVTKEKWRLEYAESMMKQRGFIYNDLETAMLHAQHGTNGRAMKIIEKKQNEESVEVRFDNGTWVKVCDGSGTGIGSWEYQTDEDDEETYSEGFLEFEGRTLTGYDGCFELPKEVIVAVAEFGYKIDL